MNRLVRTVLSARLLGASLAAVGMPAANASYPNCNSAALAVNVYGRADGPKALLPAVNGSTNTLCVMGTWMSASYNPGVVALQRALNACYTQGLTVDGYFGSKTQAALKRVQSAVGTTADGVYGPKTKAAMYWPMYNDGRAYGCDPGSVLNDAG